MRTLSPRGKLRSYLLPKLWLSSSQRTQMAQSLALVVAAP